MAALRVEATLDNIGNSWSGVRFARGFGCRFELAVMASANLLPRPFLAGVSFHGTLTIAQGGLAILLNLQLPVPQLPSDSFRLGGGVGISLRYALTRGLALRFADELVTFAFDSAYGIPSEGRPRWGVELLFPVGMDYQVTDRWMLGIGVRVSVLVIEKLQGTPAAFGFFPYLLPQIHTTIALTRNVDITISGRTTKAISSRQQSYYLLSASGTLRF
jgi:hypothetical protein